MFQAHTLPKCKLKLFCLSKRLLPEKDGSGYGLHFITAPKYETLVLGSAWPNENLQPQDRSVKDDSLFGQVLVALGSFFRFLHDFCKHLLTFAYAKKHTQHGERLLEHAGTESFAVKG